MKAHSDPLAFFLKCLGLTITLSACGHGLQAVPEDSNPLVARALQISKELEEQELPYSRQAEDLQDCSGIFHRVLNRLRVSCDGFLGPELHNARSTGTIAVWYAERNRLVVVEDALRQDELIEPGMVLFYGAQNRKYSAMTRKKALREIEHLGIVVEVERQEGGGVLFYRLFHGRSPGRVASVTYHGRNPSRKSDPPLGNGNQQWIAAARLCQDASCHCSR